MTACSQCDREVDKDEVVVCGHCQEAFCEFHRCFCEYDEEDEEE